MLGLGGSQELRERRRVLCCIDIDSETFFFRLFFANISFIVSCVTFSGDLRAQR